MPSLVTPIRSGFSRLYISVLHILFFLTLLYSMDSASHLFSQPHSELPEDAQNSWPRTGHTGPFPLATSCAMPVPNSVLPGSAALLEPLLPVSASSLTIPTLVPSTWLPSPPLPWNHSAQGHCGLHLANSRVHFLVLLFSWFVAAFGTDAHPSLWSTCLVTSCSPVLLLPLKPVLPSPLLASPVPTTNCWRPCSTVLSSFFLLTYIHFWVISSSPIKIWSIYWSIPELQTHRFNCLLPVSTWIPNEHIKVNMSKTSKHYFHFPLSILVFPGLLLILVNGTSIHSAV